MEVGDTVSAGQASGKLDISATMANYETASMSYDNAKKSYAEQSSLLSQQAVSYTHLAVYKRQLLEWCEPHKVNLALPSLRADNYIGSAHV